MKEHRIATRRWLSFYEKTAGLASPLEEKAGCASRPWPLRCFLFSHLFLFVGIKSSKEYTLEISKMFVVEGLTLSCICLGFLQPE